MRDYIGVIKARDGERAMRKAIGEAVIVLVTLVSITQLLIILSI